MPGQQYELESEQGEVPPPLHDTAVWQQSSLEVATTAPDALGQQRRLLPVSSADTLLAGQHWLLSHWSVDDGQQYVFEPDVTILACGQHLKSLAHVSASTPPVTERGLVQPVAGQQYELEPVT